MRLSPLFPSLAALLIAAALLAGAWLLLTPRGPVLTSAAFSLAAIRPNADGDAGSRAIRAARPRPHPPAARPGRGGRPRAGDSGREGHPTAPAREKARLSLPSTGPQPLHPE